MGRRIDVGNGKVWARCVQLAPELGRWVEMPEQYDPTTVTYDDLVHDIALRLLTDEEVERAEACTGARIASRGPAATCAATADRQRRLSGESAATAGRRDMLTAHDIEILTIAHCSAPHGHELQRFAPPPGELARLAERGLLRLSTVQRATIDRGTGIADVYEDSFYEPTAAGDDAVERAVHGVGLSDEARKMLRGDA